MAESLTEFSEALAESVKQAGASVVRVEGRRRLPGTGIIWSAEGVIVTANHVVKRDESIIVGMADGSTTNATVAGRDPSRDLALLRVDASDLPAATVREGRAKVGNLALALGRPGRNVQATVGIISAVSEGEWRTPAGGEVDHYLQTDVLMYPGFSGGPLLDVAGQVVGLNSSALVRGASVALPAATLSEVAAALLAHGRMRRGYLGVSTQPVRLPEKVREAVGQETGLLIISVEKDSPAEAGGLVLGDTIVSLDGHPVRHHDDLLALLSGDRVGHKVPVGIVRGGESQTVNVTVGER
ncbi:MAG: trypsin-like peptidase domain-containing protein [Candidatus Promineifilaceae bacterium]|nr:trypsin-like peptidase domain-containing protein [Candidatus Promineifilaceae bacterium]